MTIRQRLATAASHSFSLAKTAAPKALIVLPVAAGFLLGTATQTAESAPQSKPAVLTVQPDELLPADLPVRPCSPDNTVVTSCYWDAAQQGNGQGYSYVINERGHIIYLEPELNDTARRVDFNDKQADAGKDYWGTYDGHPFCWAEVGDTSYVTCFDGYKTTT